MTTAATNHLAERLELAEQLREGADIMLDRRTCPDATGALSKRWTGFSNA